MILNTILLLLQIASITACFVTLRYYFKVKSIREDIRRSYNTLNNLARETRLSSCNAEIAVNQCNSALSSVQDCEGKIHRHAEEFKIVTKEIELMINPPKKKAKK